MDARIKSGHDKKEAATPLKRPWEVRAVASRVPAGPRNLKPPVLAPAQQE